MQKLEFSTFLDSSLQLLAEQVPPAYAGVSRALASSPMRIVVDGDARVLRFTNGSHTLDPDSGALGELHTTRQTILALIDGDLSLLEAVVDDRLFLRGSLDTVTRFERALTTYLAGAVRAPGFPRLLQDYRMRPAPPT